MSSKKQSVIITGGNQGIGAGISKIFYENGYHVLLASRKDKGLAANLGEKARFHKLDVRSEKEHLDAIETMLKWTGGLNVFINCAGFSEWSPLSEVDENFWNQMIDTNLKGTFWGCKTASSILTSGGSIINISSLAGKRGSANNSVYCASKFGINGITQALAKELGPRGIRVNAVCPVYVESEGLLKALENKNSPTQGKDISSYLSEFTNANAALKKLPSAEEIASVCLFLASPASSAITGQCINVDCGVLPQ